MNQPIFITAGQVYGLLDDNKLVGNRVRGIWATKFAEYLLQRGYRVTLLIPDTLKKEVVPQPYLNVITHRGFYDYAAKCEELAPTHAAAIMAAAVVNWIPETPVKGKMPTKGYNEGDIINIPFILAPRVIDRMRIWNPNITLIGCKMLIDSQPDELIDAAYDVVLRAKCNIVVANDMGNGLRLKRVVHQDRTVIDFNDDFAGFFDYLRNIIDDQHFSTVQTDPTTIESDPRAVDTFNRITNQYRSRFSCRQAGIDRVFGSLLVPITGRSRSRFAPRPTGGYLISPREKGKIFTSEDAARVPVQDFNDHHIYVAPGPKATLNAPLLVRMWERWEHHPQVAAVLHLHEQLPDAPTAPYAPPGTARDNLRDLDNLPSAFNIEGHGFIACLDSHGQILSLQEK